MTELYGKAFYNLLRVRWRADHEIHVEPWQVEDYRAVSDKELFERLQALNIEIDLETLRLYIDKCDSPEELTDCLILDDHQPGRYGEAYLLLFEAWRRFYPKKETLSLFCDELDFLIDQFDNDTIEDAERLAEQLLELSAILDGHVDEGEKPRDIFEQISSYCAHDLESFIYEFISSEIDGDNELTGSEVLDAFYPYISDKKWYDFLRARLMAQANIEEAKVMLERLYCELEEYPDIDLGLDMLKLTIQLGESYAFQTLLDLVGSWVEIEDDFKQLLSIVRDYFCAMDHEYEEQVIDTMLKTRENIPPDAKFFPTSEDLKSLKATVHKFNQGANLTGMKSK